VTLPAIGILLVSTMLSVFEGPSVDRTLQNDESGASCKPPAGKTSVAFRQSQLGIRKGPLSRCADCKEARLFSGVCLYKG
jgi:hypothetical protein